MVMSSIPPVLLRQVLTLAQRGFGSARPNPMVGAIVLNDARQVVGQGYHAKPGQPHAEIMALAQAGEDSNGATLIVSLEPCNHTGRTGPCTQAIITAGISHVVYLLADPSAKASGGAACLQQAGLTVTGPEQLPKDITTKARWINRHFLHHSTHNTPYVTVKLALSLDGKIATRLGQSQWLTGKKARQAVHYQRANADAILTTAKTVLADNASLTVRNLSPTAWATMQANGFTPPIRVVLDTHLSLPQQDPLPTLFTDGLAPTWVFSGTNSTKTIGTHVKLYDTPLSHNTLDIAYILQCLHQQGVGHVWVEAGGKLAYSLLTLGLINELVLFYAPLVMGDEQALSGFSGGVLAQLSQAQRWHLAQNQAFGNDVMLVYTKL
jgi:diaminohydroxyphosphoribosylaminopyrimidine deaminase / 5-amino-6-(5-phosphoribosylamino)uracil reductase